MMMTIAVNSNPPASERVTGKFEFNSKMTASAAQSPVTLSSLLQTSSGPAGKDRDGQHDVDDGGAC